LAGSAPEEIERFVIFSSDMENPLSPHKKTAAAQAESLCAAAACF
jgi:hypothetical protein